MPLKLPPIQFDSERPPSGSRVERLAPQLVARTLDACGRNLYVGGDLPMVSSGSPEVRLGGHSWPASMMLSASLSAVVWTGYPNTPIATAWCSPGVLKPFPKTSLFSFSSFCHASHQRWGSSQDTRHLLTDEVSEENCSVSHIFAPLCVKGRFPIGYVQDFPVFGFDIWIWHL